MLVLLLTAFLTFSGQALDLHRGQEPGNEIDDGGNVIFCSQSKDGKLEKGYYMLDYIYALTISPYTISKDFNSSEAYLNRIESILEVVSPYLHSSFKEFRNHVYELPVGGDGGYGWIGNTATLKNIPPSHFNFRRKFPSCSEKHIFQLVRREERRIKQRYSEYLSPVAKDRNYSVTFHYNSEFLDEIEKRPLQESFLIVHEWLWNFLEKPIEVYKLNAFLHSGEAEFYTSTPPAFWQILTERGVKNEWVFLEPKDYLFHKSVEEFIDMNYRLVQSAYRRSKIIRKTCIDFIDDEKIREVPNFADFYKKRKEFCYKNYRGDKTTQQVLSLKSKFDELNYKSSNIKVQLLENLFLEMLLNFHEIEVANKFIESMAVESSNSDERKAKDSVPRKGGYRRHLLILRDE